MSAREESLLGIVARGGMVVLREDIGKVYRGRDARRGSAGCLDRLKVEALAAKGILICKPDAEDRFVWGQSIEARADTLRTVPPPIARPHAKPSRTLVEAVFRLAEKEGKRAYISSAAGRFLRDVEAREQAGAVTMNWSFVAQSRQKKMSGAGGMYEVQLAAKWRLEQLECALGAEDMTFLRAFLVEQRTAKRLALDFDIAARDVSIIAFGRLERLAQTYDRHVARETG